VLSDFHSTMRDEWDSLFERRIDELVHTVPSMENTQIPTDEPPSTNGLH
jgi:hypothetical protein